MRKENLAPQIEKKIQAWLKGPYDPLTKQAIRELLESNPQALSDAFFKDLSFGTGGMRGVMGIGTNRMNEYTVRRATQGLANYLLKQSPKKPSVFIGYDVRHRSREFAEETARVLAANGIRALVSKEVCPTPLVSFACRHFQCSAGVMITASHNPPQYNGYKVYWNDGGQIVPPHDAGILEEVERIQNPDQVKTGGSFEEVGSELDAAYLAVLRSLKPLTQTPPLKILYTNLHGTGIRFIPSALKEWGHDQLTFVEKQRPLDGNFPFAPSSNPEEAKAFEMGAEQLVQEQGDLLIATDPDADRIGLAILHQGKPVLLTGNQIACVCLHHLCSTQSVSSREVAIKTIVTTELFKKIAESYGALCIDVLTGFKYIGEQIRHLENTSRRFLFGAEESYGYLMGTSVRDKDAAAAACLIADAAATAKKEGMTLVDRLHQIYRKFGIHRETLKNIAFSDSQEGLDQMQSLMLRLREQPPASLADTRIVNVEDYLAGQSMEGSTGLKTSLSLPSADVLRFWFADGSKLVIRPSGTEPKMKIYAEVIEKNSENMEESVLKCDARLKTLIASFENHVRKK